MSNEQTLNARLAQAEQLIGEKDEMIIDADEIMTNERETALQPESAAHDADLNADLASVAPQLLAHARAMIALVNSLDPSSPDPQTGFGWETRRFASSFALTWAYEARSIARKRIPDCLSKIKQFREIRALWAKDKLDTQLVRLGELENQLQFAESLCDEFQLLAVEFGGEPVRIDNSASDEGLVLTASDVEADEAMERLSKKYGKPK
jgi:hypothetical protein